MKQPAVCVLLWGWQMTEYTIAALLLIGALCFILGAVYGALVNEIVMTVRRRPFDVWYGGGDDDQR